jgi:hypothetical protein
VKVVTADPEDVLDYEFDFASDYPDTDNIATKTVTASDPSVTVSGITHAGDRVVAFATGGEIGTTVELKCKVTTTEGRTLVRRTSMLIRYR